MEFEASAPISDADRRQAETKKLTLQPLHSDITPDALEDTQIAAQHVIAPAIANIGNDTEESTSRILPTKSLLDAHTSPATQPRKLITGITLGTILFVGLTIFAILK